MLFEGGGLASEFSKIDHSVINIRSIDVHPRDRLRHLFSERAQLLDHLNAARADERSLREVTPSGILRPPFVRIAHVAGEPENSIVYSLDDIDRISSRAIDSIAHQLGISHFVEQDKSSADYFDKKKIELEGKIESYKSQEIIKEFISINDNISRIEEKISDYNDQILMTPPFDISESVMKLSFILELFMDGIDNVDPAMIMKAVECNLVISLCEKQRHESD